MPFQAGSLPAVAFGPVGNCPFIHGRTPDASLAVSSNRIGFLSRRVSGKITIQPGHPSQRLAVKKGFTVNGDNLLAGKLKKRSVSATGQWAASEPPGMTPMSEVPRRSLGRTALQVSVLGVGTAPLGDLYVQLDDVTAIATVERAFELGINLLDTSPLYGNGLAEHRCGTAIRRVQCQDIVVCTKVGRWMDPFHGRGDGSGFVGGQPHRAVVDYSYDGTMRSVEQSLVRLGTDRLDLLLIHDVDVWTHGIDAIEDRFREAMAGAYVALDRLRGEGVVAGIGIGVNEAEMCVRFAQAGSFDTMLLAGRYSLLEQPALVEFLPLAQQQGIGVLLGGVFNSGILATGAVSGAKYNYRDAPPEILAKVERIERVCVAHGIALPTAALHFALGHPAVASVVLGGQAPQEVERNVAALSSKVPAALWADLKAERLLDAEAPVPVSD
jgi:D-threo-aldose 1-dehydrogenase